MTIFVGLTIGCPMWLVWSKQPVRSPACGNKTFSLGLMEHRRIAVADRDNDARRLLWDTLRKDEFYSPIIRIMLNDINALAGIASLCSRVFQARPRIAFIGHRLCHAHTLLDAHPISTSGTMPLA